MATAHANGQNDWRLGELPYELHELAIRENAEEQLLYQNLYAAIWNEGGKDAKLLPAMRDAALSLIAVIGTEECTRDALGPRPCSTHAIAMVVLQMYRFLVAIRERDAAAPELVRRVGLTRTPISGTPRSYTCEPDFAPCVPSGYADVAAAIAKAIPATIFGSGVASSEDATD